MKPLVRILALATLALVLPVALAAGPGADALGRVGILACTPAPCYDPCPTC